MPSIRNVLQIMGGLANEYLQNINHRSDDWLTITNIIDQNGAVNELSRDKIVMTLYNITRENSISTYSPAKPGPDSFAIVQPPIYIDLHLMFMANFSDQGYADGLEAISLIIGFFQQNPWFSQTNAPNLDPDIDKITLDLTSLDAAEVNHVMGMLGTNYLPSVFYKLRMLPFASTAMQARTYPVGGGGIGTTPQSAAPQ